MCVKDTNAHEAPVVQLPRKARSKKALLPDLGGMKERMHFWGGTAGASKQASNENARGGREFLRERKSACVEEKTKPTACHGRQARRKSDDDEEVHC
jgi:hypothetical protein